MKIVKFILKILKLILKKFIQTLKAVREGYLFWKLPLVLFMAALFSIFYMIVHILVFNVIVTFLLHRVHIQSPELLFDLIFWWTCLGYFMFPLTWESWKAPKSWDKDTESFYSGWLVPWICAVTWPYWVAKTINSY